MMSERTQGAELNQPLNNEDTSRSSWPWMKVISMGVAVLVIAGFLALMAFGLANKSSVTGRSGVTRIGKPAPQFTLPLYGGGTLDSDQPRVFDLSEYRGRPVVINFWASWCAPCRDEAPILEKLWKQYRDDGVLFVGVNMQDAETDSRAYLEEFGITYPNGLDEGGRITVDYGVIGIPVTFFINKDGIVERRWVGAVREAQLTTWVEELIAGVAPAGDVEVENLEGYRQLN
jgi:cytochrome c biogenesis protein CcmG/thiol:disulfide interchange protein DsbE